MPWENVFVYGDVDKINEFFPLSGLHPAVHVPRLHALRGQARLHRRPAAQGASRPPAPRTSAACRRASARCIAWRNLFWALTDAMARNPEPWIGDARAAQLAVRRWPTGCSRTHGVSAGQGDHRADDLGSALIYINSHAVDFKTPEIRPLPRPVRPRLERLRRGRAREAHEAAVGRGRHRVRRPPRALRAQLRRQPREHPPRGPAHRAWRPARPTRSRASPSSAWPSTTSTAGPCPDLIDNADVALFGKRNGS